MGQDALLAIRVATGRVPRPAERGPSPWRRRRPLRRDGGWRLTGLLPRAELLPRWLPGGLGLAVALCAKSRKYRHRISRSLPTKRSPDAEEESRPAAQPWSTSFLGDSQEDEEEAIGDAADGQKAEAEMDDDTWAFWDEQERPTKGAGGRPRVRSPEPLPEPLPLLVPPPQAEPEDAETGAEKDGQPTNDDGANFARAYGKDKSTIMDIDGSAMKVPEMSTFEEAAKKLRFRPFLQAALVKRDFYHLTPVQQCTMPLLLMGRDFLASAFTGSGKTAAYLLPILSSVDQLSRLQPGTMVAAHFKVSSGGRSAKPLIGRIRGIKQGLAAIEFEQATGLVKRQMVPPDWVVGMPEQKGQGSWKGPARPLAVVLVPTRELSEQVHEEARSFTVYSDIRSVALYGSSGIRSQLRDLAHGADILVSTPGRLVDALHRGVCQLDRVRHLVFDEVDRMMELGFGSQLEEIMEQGGMTTTATGGRQTSFWSATIPNSVRELIEAFLGKECVWVDCTGGQTNPVPATIQHVLIDARPPHRVLRQFEAGNEVITNKGRRGVVEFAVGSRWRVMFTDGDLVEHKMMKRSELSLVKLKTEAVQRDRLNMLRGILRSRDLQKATVIVFCRRRDTVSEVYQFLKEKFLGVVICHGGMSQAERSRSVQQIRDGEADILVATDIAARGLDMPNITHVVNFELPQVVDEFVHRCGRTGRIGRAGTAVTMVTGRENIFKPVRRLILEQNQSLPPWFSLEGMYLPWRPRFYRPPFDKVKETPTRMAPADERRQHMEKLMSRERRKKSLLMERALKASEMDLKEATGRVDKEGKEERWLEPSEEDFEDEEEDEEFEDWEAFQEMSSRSAMLASS